MRHFRNVGICVVVCVLCVLCVLLLLLWVLCVCGVCYNAFLLSISKMMLLLTVLLTLSLGRKD